MKARFLGYWLGEAAYTCLREQLFVGTVCAPHENPLRYGCLGIVHHKVCHSPGHLQGKAGIRYESKKTTELDQLKMQHYENEFGAL